MLSRLYPTILDIDGLLADVPHDGYADAVAATFADPAMVATLGGARLGEGAAGFIARARAHWREAGFGLWFLRDMRDGGFAGWGGLRRCELAGDRGVEFAYALSPRLRCKGNAVRLGQAALQLGFERLALREIVAVTTAENQHALGVTERLGFEYVRSLDRPSGRHLVYSRTAAAHAAA
ncbi:GNAT family N-acetyltransferase [Hansschlegelia sp.]|uniref:GNAT family N-acetyltransferase n=1 Tax=Hansschlegelia sp. TaxID=2041892 RepID=UPI002C30C5A1|nr:GNAT family N-acetyltransferase [Hansschlegelia sp.]HVI28331.1 GNAT family N-acetyltransferase [Hansschlegelia sp.]